MGEPEAISKDGWEDLLEGTTTTPPPTVVDASETVDIDLYFIGGENKLERVPRAYPASPQINDVLQELEDPPRPEDQEQFADAGVLLRTVVPVGLNATLLTETEAQQARGVRVLSVDPEGGLRELLDQDPPKARLVVSQIVCTFLNLPSSSGIGVEIVDPEGPLVLTDIDSQTINRPALPEHFGDCRTGTEERAELVEEAEGGGEAEDGGDADGSTTTTTTGATTTTTGATTTTER